MGVRGDSGKAIAELVASRVIDVPDFPKPGIVFKDLMPLFADGGAFARSIDAIVEHHGPAELRRGGRHRGPRVRDRGGGRVRDRAGVVPVRKAGKLPRRTHVGHLRAGVRRGHARGARRRLHGRAAGAGRRRRAGHRRHRRGHARPDRAGRRDGGRASACCWNWSSSAPATGWRRARCTPCSSSPDRLSGHGDAAPTRADRSRQPSPERVRWRLRVGGPVSRVAPERAGRDGVVEEERSVSGDVAPPVEGTDAAGQRDA